MFDFRFILHVTIGNFERRDPMSSRYTHGSGAHQRDGRTQLFSTPHRQFSNTPPSRMGSPYDKTATNSAKYNEAYLLSLESQNNEEIDLIGKKVTLLKELGVRMGGEINKSLKINDEITDTMERGKVTLKHTWNKMIIMSQRAGISWRMWLLVFFVIFLWFLWVWLF